MLWIYKLLEHLGGIEVADVFPVPNNYWGTSDTAEIERLLRTRDPDLRIEFRPFATEFITEALPDWLEFEW